MAVYDTVDFLGTIRFKEICHILLTDSNVVPFHRGFIFFFHIFLTFLFQCADVFVALHSMENLII